MAARLLDYIAIPERAGKPRRQGLTLARDLGLGYAETASWLEAVGEFIDYVKIRHLFVLLMSGREDDLVRRKIALYRSHDIDVNPGGIVFEMAHADGQADRLFDDLASHGFTAVECSENIVTLTLAQKLAYVRRASAAGLKVLFEVGEKYPAGPLDVERASEEILTLLDAGCELCILERALIEQCLGTQAGQAEHPDAVLLDQLAARVGLERLVFEAEASAHQVWLLQRFGSEVNLGPNLDKDAILKLEPTRRTLSREGGYGFLFDKARQLDARQDA